MALEFLSKDIGGYSNAPAPGKDYIGRGPSLGTPNTGITWGQLLSTAMQKGSGNPTTQRLGGMLGSQFSGQVPTYQIQGIPLEREEDESSSFDWGKLISAAITYFGI